MWWGLGNKSASDFFYIKPRPQSVSSFAVAATSGHWIAKLVVSYFTNVFSFRIINCIKVGIRLEVWFRDAAWLTPHLSSALQLVILPLLLCLCSNSCNESHAYCMFVRLRWRWNTTPWLEEYNPQGKQASLLCVLLFPFSSFVAHSKTPWRVCVTAALVKPASTAADGPEAFIHRADSLSLWHSLCGTETSFTLTPLPKYPLPNYHTPLGKTSMGLSAQIWVNKSTKPDNWSCSVATSRGFRVYCTALVCKCVYNVGITSLQNKNNIHFSVNKDKTVCHSLFLPWQWWVRPLLFVLFPFSVSTQNSEGIFPWHSLKGYPGNFIITCLNFSVFTVAPSFCLTTHYDDLREEKKHHVTNLCNYDQLSEF